MADAAKEEAAKAADAEAKAAEAKVAKAKADAEVSFIATAPGTTARHGFVRTGESKTILVSDFTGTWMKPKTNADVAKVAKYAKAKAEQTDA